MTRSNDQTTRGAGGRRWRRLVDGLEREAAPAPGIALPTVTHVFNDEPEDHWLVEGLTHRRYESEEAARAGAELLHSKRMCEAVAAARPRSAAHPVAVGQVYCMNAGFFFHPCARLFPSRQDADLASLYYLAALGLGAETEAAALRYIEAGNPVTLNMLHWFAAVPREGNSFSWDPVADVCKRLQEQRIAGNCSSLYHVCEKHGDGHGMFHQAALLTAVALLKTLAADPGRAGYDVCDVYQKLTLCCRWVSYPTLEDLRGLHHLVGVRVRGTPWGARWDPDPLPALTRARLELDGGPPPPDTYRLIRREPT